jgi:hypothetical protein
MMTTTYVSKIDELLERYVKTLKQAVTGEIQYDSTSYHIQRAETYLRLWLEGMVTQETTMFMEFMYREFKELFPYEGKLYRGMRIEPGAELYPMNIASFTDRREVACKFSGTEEFECEHTEEEGEQDVIFIETYGIGALALDDLQFVIMGLTTNQEFWYVMDDMVGEHEKLYPFSEELTQLY